MSNEIVHDRRKYPTCEVPCRPLHEELNKILTCVRQKISQRLYLFVTAIDQTVIARPNFKINNNCWEQLPHFNSDLNFTSQNVIDTPIHQHVQNLIIKEKYSFLYKNQLEQENILENIGAIKLSSIFIGK